MCCPCAGNAVKDFTEDMGIIGNYSHGTHVAGIVAAGNPFVRLLRIRETFPYKEIPRSSADTGGIHPLGRVRPDGGRFRQIRPRARDQHELADST